MTITVLDSPVSYVSMSILRRHAVDIFVILGFLLIGECSGKMTTGTYCIARSTEGAVMLSTYELRPVIGLSVLNTQ